MVKEPTIYIGIPQWDWKKPLVSFAQRHPRLIEIESLNLCYECKRHRQLLDMFDSKNDKYKESEYFLYQLDNKKRPKDILDKINRFHSLYESIKIQGCLHPPIVTLDGCRLDGSHRSSILVHLGKKTAMVNIARYEDVFTAQKCRQIKEEIRHFRKSYYGLESP